MSDNSIGRDSEIDDIDPNFILYIKDSVNLKSSRVLVHILISYEALYRNLYCDGLCGKLQYAIRI